MSAIDSTYYPHIVDRVFAFALVSWPRSDLLSLRAVNRKLRQRVYNYLAYHLDYTYTSLPFSDLGKERHPLLQNVLFHHLINADHYALYARNIEASQPSQQHLRQGPPRAAKLKALDRLNHGVWKKSDWRNNLDFLLRLVELCKHTRVVDWSGEALGGQLFDGVAHHNCYELLQLGPQTVFPSIRAMRILGYGSFRWASVPRLRCVDQGPLPPFVWFHPLEPTAAGHHAHYRYNPIPTTRLTWTVTFHPFDTALHHTSQGGKAWVPPFYTSDATQEFAFLFVPDESRALRLREHRLRGLRRVVQPRAVGEVGWNDYRSAEGKLGVLEDVLFHIAPELERSHIFAGLEGLPPQALGLAAGTTQEEVFDAVRQGIRDMLLNRRNKETDRVVHADLWPDELVDQCVANVKILTLDEYREMVGEEQFEYESKVELSRG